MINVIFLRFFKKFRVKSILNMEQQDSMFFTTQPFFSTRTCLQSTLCTINIILVEISAQIEYFQSQLITQNNFIDDLR